MKTFFGRAVVLALLLSSCTSPHGQRTISRDEATPLGITAGEVVAKAEGVLRGQLVWTSSSESGYPEVLSLPVSGATGFTAEIFCNGGESRLLADLGHDTIEIDCWVTVVSDDGMFHDTWPGVLSEYLNAEGLPGHEEAFGPFLDTGWLSRSEVNGKLREFLPENGWIQVQLGTGVSSAGQVGLGVGKMEDDGTGNWGGGTWGTPIATFAAPSPR
ncbi:MAG: hypothetical protein QM765_08885 [Myxococcales bacterium]